MKATIRLKDTSLSELDSKYRDQISKKINPMGSMDTAVCAPSMQNYWVQNVYPNMLYAIVSKGSNELYRVSFTLDMDGNIATIGALVPVEITYVDKKVAL
jgi:peroxiredoxin